MRRLRPLRFLLLSAVLPVALAACGGAATVTGPVPHAADAQQATLGWVESAGSTGSRLVFRVGAFRVTAGGWSARLTVTNDTSATFTITGISAPFRHAFGVMVFRTGSHDELERRNAEASLPVLREAMKLSPALPRTLAPDTTWSGTASATGSLPSGSWIRVVFGAFDPTQAMPRSLAGADGAKDVIWITDHAHQLR